MKYIKYKKPAIKRLETYLKESTGESKREIEEALSKFKYKSNTLVEEKYFDVLRKYDMYADNFIEYYLNSEEEEIQIAMFKYDMLPYIMTKLEKYPFLTREAVRTALDNKQGKYILMRYIRKIERVLNVDLSRYIIKVGILDMSSELRVLTDKEERDSMYDIARKLSVKYNIGYKLSYIDRSIVIEGDNNLLELHWEKGCVYHGTVVVANMLTGTNKSAEKIVNYYKKKRG